MLWRMCALIWLHFDKISSTIATACTLQSQMQFYDYVGTDKASKLVLLYKLLNQN